MEDVNGTVTVVFDGRTICAERGAILSEVLLLEQPCGGHGRCGKCKVTARGVLSELSRSEREYLTEEEIARGVRLACCASVEGDCFVMPISHGETHQKHRIVTDGAMPALSPLPSFSRYGVAVDVGTTTLAARLYDADGTLLSENSRLNPQSTYGADVVSRIEASLGGKAKRLAEAVTGAINQMLLALSGTAGIHPFEIDCVVITGNTTMLTLLTETSPEPLSHAPFRAERLFGERIIAKELGLSAVPPATEIYLPPCISAFVGADTVCAILATELTKKNETALLADVGTNGEIALWHDGHLLVSSTAAGPAFEGVGISMGMRATLGAIDRVSPVNGRLQAHVIGDGRAHGICGSGLIDAVASLLDLEEIDETGYLESDPVTVLEPVVLTGKDIRMVQLAKSAVSAGIRTLLRTAELSENAVSTLYVAGGFGNYLNMKNAGRIGLFPKVLSERVSVAGNAALVGASMILLSRPLFEECRWIADKAEVVELAANPIFADLYMAGMMF